MTQQRVQVEDQRNFWFCFLDIAIMTDVSLSAYDKVVYAALCSFSSVEGRSCFPSMASLAKRAACSPRKARESLRILEEKGYISRSDRSDQGLTSIYTLKGGGTTCRGGAAPPAGGAARHADRTIATELEPDLEPAPTEGASAPGLESHQETADIPGQDHEAEAKQEDLLSPQEAPSVFRETVELFCHKTGRRGITREELDNLRDLGKLHTPARIQREITTALERFGKKGRDPGELTFGYLWEALRHQKTLRSGGGAPPSRKTREITEEDREEWGIR